ncbi:MAG: GNAT family N-acetyltransferase [Clostridia bacterium]|nr:GNAT family N-acetyltransferase [Clostridia bacterium]
MKTLQFVDDVVFQTYHALYSPENIFLHFDWQQMLDNFHPHGKGCLVVLDDVPIGGIIVDDDYITAPFLIPPFMDQMLFWKTVGQLTEGIQKLQYIPDTHSDILQKIGAKKVRSKYQMIRPTAHYDVNPKAGFFFDSIRESDKAEMADAILKAHNHGYVGLTEGRLDICEVKQILEKRLKLFSETNTLGMGTVVREGSTNRIAAVCVAGIYPDVPNCFATIHQVAVLPEFRRRGLARSMILRTIDTAAHTSPAVVLGVLKGNPAEVLYAQLGFRAGCAYSDYVL